MNYNERLAEALFVKDESSIIRELKPILLKESASAGELKEDVQQELAIELIKQYRKQHDLLDESFAKYLEHLEEK